MNDASATDTNTIFNSSPDIHTTTNCDANGRGAGWIAVGAILAGLAVVLGAFAAHGLDTFFARKYAGEVRTVVGSEVPAATKSLNDFKTGADYQMLHALGLIAVGLTIRLTPRGATGLTATAWLFVVGILCFSGSLYLLTLTGQRWLGAIAPIGGTALILGWVTFAVTVWRSSVRTAAPHSRSLRPMPPLNLQR